MGRGVQRGAQQPVCVCANEVEPAKDNIAKLPERATTLFEKAQGNGGSAAGIQQRHEYLNRNQCVARIGLGHAASASLARVRFTMSDKLPSAHRTRYMPGYFGSATIPRGNFLTLGATETATPALSMGIISGHAAPRTGKNAGVCRRHASA